MRQSARGTFSRWRPSRSEQGEGYLISSGTGHSATIALLRVKIREIQTVIFRMRFPEVFADPLNTNRKGVVCERPKTKTDFPADFGGRSAQARRPPARTKAGGRSERCSRLAQVPTSPERSGSESLAILVRGTGAHES